MMDDVLILIYIIKSDLKKKENFCFLRTFHRQVQMGMFEQFDDLFVDLSDNEKETKD